MDFHFERSGAVVLLDALPRFRPFGTPEPSLEVITRASLAAMAQPGLERLMAVEP